jgi:hypothetical protein
MSFKSERSNLQGSNQTRDHTAFSFHNRLDKKSTDHLSTIRWPGDFVHHLFKAIRSSFNEAPPKGLLNMNHYHEYGIRYTKPIRHLIQLMRWRVRENPGYFGHIYARSKRSRKLKNKISIDSFLRKNLKAPIKIHTTQTKIIYLSRHRDTPWIVIESPFERYFRVARREHLKMVDRDHYRSMKYLNIDLSKSSSNGELYFEETHFDYEPYSRQEESMFQNLGLFKDEVFDPIRDQLSEVIQGTPTPP